jgi:hypothetical protein
LKNEITRVNYTKTLTRLPWNKTEVYSTGNLIEAIEHYIPAHVKYFLPSSIVVLYDTEVTTELISDFIGKVIDYLTIEFKHREERKKRFIGLGLLSDNDFKQVILKNKTIQPWILYYSQSGGLGKYDSMNNSALTGMIPCASMRNHAVAWQTKGDNFKMWLVTSRKENSDWDWDSDLGHESGHACFAPIPLFVQSLHLEQGESAELLHVDSIYDMTADHIARICYIITEIAVIAVRGERRETISGLPVAENPEEFKAFLRLSDLLMPGLGFNNVLQKYSESDTTFVDVNQSDIIYYIGAACLKGLSQIKENFKSLKIPSIDMFPFLLLAKTT